MYNFMGRFYALYQYIMHCIVQTILRCIVPISTTLNFTKPYWAVLYKLILCVELHMTRGPVLFLDVLWTIRKPTLLIPLGHHFFQYNWSLNCSKLHSISLWHASFYYITGSSLYCAELQVADMQLAFRTLLEVQYLCATSHKRRDVTRLTILFEK
jgi:hypothetical protein